MHPWLVACGAAKPWRAVVQQRNREIGLPMADVA
jgi:hypothetical protein